eukprot:CAMPEP_0174740906 /NCGR_PEP_ID=MMETSP1094-20130205/74796_1 /TAXON_ID=156173 /ORGANISM="Chrysochromulina brevifilum, Strain UTEX LB 985" /LENGTH=65 /DNA_ID=CAMNT_0015944693 /DNA_START=33 /DNA_END=230 /DNA_ORIENTATION=+
MRRDERAAEKWRRKERGILVAAQRSDRHRGDAVAYYEELLNASRKRLAHSLGLEPQWTETAAELW